MTCILTTLYGFLCIDKQNTEYGISTLPFIYITKLYKKIKLHSQEW